MQNFRLLARLTQTHLPVRVPSRPFSTRRGRLGDYSLQLYNATKEPLWKLLYLYNRVNWNSPQFTTALQEAQVSLSRFNTWKIVMKLPDVAQIQAAVIESKRVAVHDAFTTHRLPPHLLLYILAYKIRRPAHAVENLPGLLTNNLPSLPQQLQPGALVMSMFHFARFNLLHFMALATKDFLILAKNPLFTHSQWETHFNLLLLSMSYTPERSVVVARSIMDILQTMEDKKFQLHRETYLVLLKNRFVTVEIARHLQQRMTQEGIVPDVDQLEAYMRVFSNHGAVEDAQQYHNMINTIVHRPQVDEASVLAMSRAEDTKIASMNNPLEAFTYLRKLASREQILSRSRSMTPDTAMERFRAVRRRQSNIYSWTAAFTVMSRNKRIAATTLVKVFNTVRQQQTTKALGPSLRLTSATYSVLIQGLLARKQLGRAVFYTYELLSSGLPIDGVALRICLQTLTLRGRPHEAFLLLEKHAARTDAPTPSTTYRIQRPLNLSVRVINGFMSDLMRIGRPDVVFALWSTMINLYGVQPDDRTFATVVDAARLATNLDDTVTGQLTLWRSTNAKSLLEDIDTRKVMLSRVTSILMDSRSDSVNPKLKRYTTSKWDGYPPHIKAKLIFCHILRTNSPGILDNVNVSPVEARRGAGKEDPTLLDFLPRPGQPKYTVWVLPDGEAANRTTYPGIVLSDMNFRQLMLLLVMSPDPRHKTSILRTLSPSADIEKRSLADVGLTEIPLLLAWMRELGIRPQFDTLVIALVLWHELNLLPPILEIRRGKPAGPYEELVEWLEGWLGPNSVPNVDHQAFYRWRDKINSMRRTDYRYHLS